MTKITAYFYGGSSYGYPQPGFDDHETFSSVAAATDAFRKRVQGRDSFYPAVSADAAMALYFGRTPTWEDNTYPDRQLVVGPRGGVQVEVC